MAATSSRWYHGEIASSTKRTGRPEGMSRISSNKLGYCCSRTQRLINGTKDDVTGHVDFSLWPDSLSLLTEKPAAEQANRQRRENCF